MSLRITILTLITSLLILTVLAIGGFGYFITKQSVKDLQAQYLNAVSSGAAKGIDSLVQIAYPLLSSINIPEDISRDIGVSEMELVKELTGHMKAFGELTYLNYGDQESGHYIAIRRDKDGQLIFNRAHQLVSAGREFEWLINDNFELNPLPQPETPPYDPRTRGWYTLAVSKGFVWTKPYKFFSGDGMGISASLPVYNQNGKLRGVISLAISLNRLSKYLQSMRDDPNINIYVTLHDGTLVASSSDNEANDTNAALKDAHQDLGGNLEGVSAGTSVISEDLENEAHSVTFYPYRSKGYLSWMIAVVIPEVTYMGVVTDNAYLVLTVGLLALISAIGVALYISGKISTPLRKISQDLRNVAEFKLNNENVPATFVHEISVVADSVARMKAGLRSFSRYVPHEEVRKILASGNDTSLGGEIRQLSLHFSDLANFSTFCETMPPDEVVKNLADYLEILTGILQQHEGTIAQYTGDGLFAFFNAPISDSEHALHAIKSALYIKDRLAEVNKIRAEKNLFLFNNRIGLHTADVVVGNIGTDRKLAYSAIGDGVNLASRLEGLNKVYGTTIIVSAAMKELTGDYFLWRKLDTVAVIGRAAPTVIYEPLCPKEAASEEQIKNGKAYESALDDYIEGNFEQALLKFEALNDTASQELARRCRAYIAEPFKGKWEGVFSPSAK